MDFIKALKLIVLLSFTALILLFLLFIFISFDVIRIVLAIAVLISITLRAAIAHLYFRCPKCRGGLYARYFKVPKFCPHCGTNIEEK